MSISDFSLSRTGIWMLVVLALAFTPAWTQDSPAPNGNSSTTGSSQNSTGQESSGQEQPPVPAYGQENAPPPITETPPLSGIDLPSVEPHAAPLSYIQPGATVSESADTNAANEIGGGGSTASITRALGSLTLQRLWSHYDLALDYMGGAGYYDLPGEGGKLLQQMDFEQKVTWKRGQLAVRDSFSYLPEGNFGAAYGSLGSQGIASLGTTSFATFWGGAALGTLGLAPRIINLSMADVSEYLSPKSAITAAGGYAFTHFYGSVEPYIDSSATLNFIGDSQVSGQIGYSRLLTPKTQVAAVYGYQGFDFSAMGTAFHSHVIQLMYGHQISGRMDLLVAAGPQFTRIGISCSVTFDPNYCTVNPQTLALEGTIPDHRIGAAGQFRLQYKFPKTMLTAAYQRYETGGSGFFAGAQSDIAHVSADRPLSRVWGAMLDLGYSRNARIQTSSSGIAANDYQYGFAGVAVHRAFGHDFHAFASYQFNKLAFDSSFCGTSSVCDRISNRNVITLGLDWTPRPIRID
ncbi:MAG TPA: hypothetical protein VMX38_05555 [Verrucomicrobiae bacterium]|nr:hypothetical protein [Verrucomicrobiae bacterium]